MNRTSHLAMLTALSAAGILLGASDSLAQQPIYGGGGTLSEPSLRLEADCEATPLNYAGTPDTTATNFPTLTLNGTTITWSQACTTPGGFGGGGSGYKYYLTGVGSGGGLIALMNEAATGLLETSKAGSGGNGPGTTGGGTLATWFDSPTDQPSGTASAFPYPFWDITDSDAPPNSPSPEPGSSATVNGDYNTGGYGPNGFSTKQNRGLMWAVPVAGTPITLTYNPTNFTFVLNPGTSDQEDHKLQLSKDAICYIYTKADQNGQVVSGNYDWSNPIFTLNSFGQTFQGASVTNPNTGAAESYPYPINSVFTANFNGTYTVSTKFSVSAGTGAGDTAHQNETGNPIIPFARSDDSGSTYLFTLWLQNNCAGFNTTTLGAAVAQPGQTLVSTPAFGTQVPATTVTWPTWVYQYYATAGGVPTGGATATGNTASSGSGGMATAAKDTDGGIAYVGPTSVEPVKASTTPTAYVENNFGGAANPLKHQYVFPSTLSVEQAVTKPGPPKLGTVKNPAYGKLNSSIVTTTTALVSTSSNVITVSSSPSGTNLTNPTMCLWQSAGVGVGSTVVVAGAGAAAGNLTTTVTAIDYSSCSTASPAAQINVTLAATPSTATTATGTAVTFTVPQTLQGTNVVAWGSGLNNIFFKTTLNGAYPITGLTYLFGYQCYANDTTSGDIYDGVKDFVKYYTNTGAGNSTDADTILLTQGLMPIDYDTGSNGTSTSGTGVKRTFTQAVYDVIANDPGTKLVSVASSTTGFPLSPSNGKPLAGPYQCAYYGSDGGHEQ